MEGNSDTTAQRPSAPIARIAWFATFVLPLLLAALLLGVKSAQAAPAVGGEAPFALEEEFEAEGEGDFEEAECEEAEGEFEEGELSRVEVEEICDESEDEDGEAASGSDSAAPEECLLRSAHAHASLVSHDNKLKLTIGYTTYEPVTAKLEIGHIAILHRHLGRSGVVRAVQDLGGGNAPKRLDVRIDIPSVKRAGCPSRRLVLFPR